MSEKTDNPPRQPDTLDLLRSLREIAESATDFPVDSAYSKVLGYRIFIRHPTSSDVLDVLVDDNDMAKLSDPAIDARVRWAVKFEAKALAETLAVWGGDVQP